MWLLVFLAFITLCILIRYHWSRRHLYLLALQCSGPLSLPIIGCAHRFLFCKSDDILDVIYQIVEDNGKIIRFWLGPELVIIFKDPKDIEKIFTSSKFSHKHNAYELLKIMLGDGLITSSGIKHRNDKRLIQPIFNLQFSSESIETFEKHIKVLIDKLMPFSEQNYFDIGHMIHLCTSDIIAEILFGAQFNALDNKNLDYVDGFTRIYQLAAERLVKPWLHPNFIFKRSSLGQEMLKICNRSHKLMQKFIEESKDRTKHCTSEYVIDKLAHLNYEDYNFTSHLITLYMASEDTVALIVSGACLCLGMYPEYQKRVVEEIGEVFEASDPITVEKIAKLPFLDMCVKEIYRIFPIAPYILRKTIEDQQLGDVFLPEGCGILIPIYNLHRDPKYWDNPTHFHPDHFLPEAEKNRPNSTYVPFSGGPRGCIGKVFANISVKVMLIRLLQRFEFVASGKLPDVRFTMDISTRARDGYNVKIKPRSSYV